MPGAAKPTAAKAAFSSADNVRRKTSVIVLLLTPGLVAPPLLAVNCGTHGGAYGDHGTCLTPGPHFTPLRATPGVPAAGSATPCTGTSERAALEGVLPEGVLADWPGPLATAPGVVPLAVVPWLPELAPGLNDCRLEPCFALLVGTRVTTSRKMPRPTASGTYRRATRAR